MKHKFVSWIFLWLWETCTGNVQALCYTLAKKKATPRLSAKELQELVDCLWGNLPNPWLCKSDFLNFHYQLIRLVDASKAIVIHLETKLDSFTSRNALAKLVRTPETHSLITKIAPASTVQQNYQKLDQDITKVAFYEPIHLLEFEFADRYSWRHSIDSLQLSHSICLYRMSYSGSFWTVSFIWKVPLNKEDEDGMVNGRAIVKVTNLMPEFHLKQMHVKSR